MCMSVSMALSTYLFCLLSLGCCGSAVQESPVSAELSCGAGPLQVVLEPHRPLRLDCHLGAVDAPLNITWLQDGVGLSESEAVRILPNRSLLLLSATHDGQALAGMEGDYSCLSGSSYGRLTSRSVTLQLARLSQFLQDPEPQVVPAGSTARFECHIDGLPAPSITWEKNHVPLPLSDESYDMPRYVTLPNGILQILEVGKDDEGFYRCRASNSAQERFSQNTSLTVTSGFSNESEVIIIARPRDSTVVLGQLAVLECIAHGQPKPIVSWSRQDGKPIATDVLVLGTNLVIPETHIHHAGVYVCRANKPKTREFVLSSAEIHVLAPPVIVQPPKSVSLSRGNTARFVCNSSASPAASLVWLKDGERLRWTARVKTLSPDILLINQLRPDDAGYYQCLASNTLGTACATAKLSVIVRAGLPSPPLHLQVISQSSTSVLLTWEPPEYNREQVIGFSIHYQSTTGLDNMEYQFAVNNDTTEFHVKELQPHTAYTFYMVAYSPMGASRQSQPVTVKMMEDVPSAPPQLSLLSTSPTEIRVMWLPLSSHVSRGAVTHYRIDYRTLERDEVFSVEVSGNNTEATLRDLKPNHTYQLRMAAVLFAPTELQVRVKMHSLHVTWQPPPNYTQITSYKLAHREVDEETAMTNEENPTTDAQHVRLRKRVKHYEISGLAPDRLYEVKVWACNKQTEGYPAIWKGRTEKFTNRARSHDHLLPLPPSSVKAQANSSTSIWLRWEKPPYSNGHHITYTIRCSPAGTRNASLISYYTSTSLEILLEALKPFTLYELAVQSNGAVSGPFSSTVEESTLADRPSSPPMDLQLSAIDSFSVLVSWRPPLEPNGIIVGYQMLYSCNLSQPDYLWTNLSHSGSVFSTEVLGLMSATRYYFKMGACTEVGVGPLSPIKYVHTPPKKYELDIHAVTGIIVGVCLGLLCILLCMCVSFRNGKIREVSGGYESNVLSPQYHGTARPVLADGPDFTDTHELETLMPSGVQNPVSVLKEPNELQSLMGSVDRSGDVQAELKLTWNGSVSRDWTNHISTYRDTTTENSCLINGPLDAKSSKDCHEEHLHSLGSNQVEAEVIVHSELYDAVEVQKLQSELSQNQALPSSFLLEPTTEIQPLPFSSPNHIQEVLPNHNGTLLQTVEGVKGSESLENGDHILCFSRKPLTHLGLSSSPPAFGRSDLVCSTSTAHGCVPKCP